VPPAPGLPWNAAPPDRFWLWSIQTALRTLDPLIVPDGRWTAWWRFRLRAVRVALGIDAAPGQARVSAALWNHAQVQAGFWANPWADGGPTEADLIERVVGMPTPRVGGPATRDLAGRGRGPAPPLPRRRVPAPPRPPRAGCLSRWRTPWPTRSLSRAPICARPCWAAVTPPRAACRLCRSTIWCW